MPTSAKLRTGLSILVRRSISSVLRERRQIIRKPNPWQSITDPGMVGRRDFAWIIEAADGHIHFRCFGYGLESQGCAAMGTE